MMSSFAFLVLCLQACLLQNVYSQCLGATPYAAYGPGFGIPPGIAAPAYAGLAPAYGLGAELIAPGIAAPLAPAAYGGAGVGDVAVVGEMPVAGTTLVAGQVPILGAVRFAGDLPAAGTVSITGSCGCGCHSGYIY